MAEEFVVNSRATLAAAQTRLIDNFEKHKHSVYRVVQCEEGTLPMNSLVHVWLTELDCCTACGAHAPLIAHHCEGSTFRHNKVYVGPWFVIGLCQRCDNKVTLGSRKGFREIYGPQSDLWHKQLQKYPLRHECPLDVFAAIANWGR